MNLLKSVFFLVSAILASGLCADEIVQGTLQNGMRYYLIPDAKDKHAMVCLAIKKPKIFFYSSKIPLFFDKHPFFSTLESNGEFYNYYVGTLHRTSLEQGVEYFASHLQEEMLSDTFLNAVRTEHFEVQQEDAEIPDAIKQEMLFFMEDFYNFDFKATNLLFSQNNATLKTALLGLLEPSRMALIIKGPIDNLSLERLNLLFGTIPEKHTFHDTIPTTSQKPFGFLFKDLINGVSAQERYL